MIQKLKLKITKSQEIGIFHDSRGDVKKLSLAINMLIDKVNELVDENNRLEKELQRKQLSGTQLND